MTRELVSGSRLTRRSGVLRALLVTTIVFLYIFFVGAPMVLYAWLTGSADALYWAGVRGARLALWLAGAKLDVQGTDRILRDRACVFMVNHLSNADPPAAVSFLPRVSILAKKQVFWVPILGYAMRKVDIVAVDRTNPDAARAAVEEAVAVLRRGRPFLVFPEGTRSRDGRLLPFKKGGFVLAIKAGVPIVPITILDSDRVMRKGKWAMYPGTIHIVVHDPIATAGYSLEQRDELVARVRAQIASVLPEEKRTRETPASKGEASVEI